MALVGLLVVVLAVPAGATGRRDHRHRRADPLRVATFNASLNRGAEGELRADLSTPDDPQAQRIAEIIQRVRPDVLLLNEFDYDPAAVDLFRDNYLEVGHNGAPPIRYRYAFIDESNTGVLPDVEVDFDNNGAFARPGDAFGFGFFPGQFGMLVLSKYPIRRDRVRTFQTFLWKDMPGALLPDDPDTPEPGDYYSDEELDVFRLSSKSHWDVPIRVGRRTVHLLASHPTPPVFDDPVIDQNGRRNHDEIRFWSDYVHPARGRYIYDDDGRRGGLHPWASFVIVGDQNADPFDGDSTDGAIHQLLDNPLVRDRFVPSSDGAARDAVEDGGVNVDHVGDPAHDTADFGDDPPFGAGNLRVDYVLPSRRLKVRGGGVFWPTEDDPLFRLVGDDDPDAGVPLSSDHRMVWLDLRVPGRR
ncbi:MAG: endonuclease/exonuclease/phosphatase family protein [Actinobacteria bacterium]|nr:endonuclease/exonuclease/phosphatase family protein [Actinomycetota bacterium]